MRIRRRGEPSRDLVFHCDDEWRVEITPARNFRSSAAEKGRHPLPRKIWSVTEGYCGMRKTEGGKEEAEPPLTMNVVRRRVEKSRC